MRRRTKFWMRVGAVGAGVAALVLVVPSTSSAVPSARVTDQGPRGAGLSVLGLVGVSESRTENFQLPPDHPAANWAAVSVLGVDVYGSSSPHHAVPAEPSGLAADAAPTIEALDDDLCPGEAIDLGDDRSAALCVGLLESSAESFLNTPHAAGSIATGQIEVIDGTDATSLDITVMPSFAEGKYPCGWAAGAALADVALGLPTSLPGIPAEMSLLRAEEDTCSG